MAHVKRIDEMNLNESWINKLLKTGGSNTKVVSAIRKALETLKEVDTV